MALTLAQALLYAHRPREDRDPKKKKILLVVALLLFASAAYQYLSAPLFWQVYAPAVPAQTSIEPQDWLEEDVFYFSGYGAQRVYISPSRELVIVRLGPAAGYFPKIAEEWDNAFLFNTAVRGIRY